MALGSDLKKQIAPEELEELLDGLEKLLDRTKVLYEQYFMGLQKLAPMQLHRDIERRVRELMQQQIRNTSLRFRFTTISQKFGAYQTYWKRTLREIEQGKYVRDLVRVKRKADAQGQDLPEELLVKLPKLVQDRIRRDRAMLAERAMRDAEEGGKRESAASAEVEPPVTELAISEEEAESLFSEGDLDIDGLFTALTATPEPRHAAPAKGEVPATGTQETEAPVTSEPASTTAAPAGAPAPAKVGPRTVTIPLTKSVPSMRPSGAGPEPGFRVPPPPGADRRGTQPPSEGPATPAEPVRPAEPVARPVVSPVKTPPPRPKAPPRPAVAPPPGMNDKQCRELYSRYVKARQLVGETTEDVTYEKLVSSLTKQADAIMSEHGAHGVEFNVVVRGDKVVLKAKPLKPGK
ncbi:MAG TPA: MXAN_5187 C-terminal domain-containing protein [Candidatus Acidoferrum sp.]|nr:MXAN_5187 C-terminal domain-containing protein [Candidatus Acidoferrum sp.]